MHSYQGASSLALLFLLMGLSACMSGGSLDANADSSDDNNDYDNNPSETSYYDSGYNQPAYQSAGLAEGLGYHTYSLGYPIYSSKNIQVVPAWITAGAHRYPYQYGQHDLYPSQNNMNSSGINSSVRYPRSNMYPGNAYPGQRVYYPRYLNSHTYR